MELSGKRYGHIRVNELIGEGGMGSVYAGFDETLHRRVAVKVLQDDQRLDPEARGRLIREARSLSRLDHPNICRIHDYIQDESVDLLVLEFIEGRTLRAAIDDGLTRAEKLRIAISIAEVLVVAHRAGIIHRDLKPENVMLTGDGTVKVLDFGLARWTEERARSIRAIVSQERTEEDGRLWVLDGRTATAVQPRYLTEVGITVGTPFFMSPEQARGEKLTPASDVHSFGLLLQTLFTGRYPYPEDLSARAVLLKAASNSSLPATGLDRRLTALVNDLKQFAPTDRPTASAAVQRLRHLETRPQRIARIAASSTLALLIVSGATKYTVDLRRERAAAVASEHRATIARQEAATRRAQAEDLITFMLGDLRTKLEPLGKLSLLDDVGARALAYSASLNPALMSSDELARSAKALGQLGAVRISQGRLGEAAPIFAQSLQMAEAAVRKDPRNQNAQLVQMAAHFGVGECARLSGRSAEALREMELYLSTARQLSAAHPANAEYRMEEAYGHANVGTLLMGSGRFADAGTHFAEALQIKRARLARDPSNAEWRADLASTIYKLGMNLHKTGDLAGAREQFEEQKRIRQELVAAAPDNAQSQYRLASAHGHLATLLLSMGEMSAAEQELHAELAIERALAAQDGENAEWARNFAVTTARIAALDARQGRTAEAAAGYRRALSMLEDIVRRDPSRVSVRGDLDIIRARSVVHDVARGDPAGARRVWERIAPPAGARSAETPERQMELLLVAMILGDATHDARQSSEARERARILLAMSAVRASTDPEVIAIRARLLVALGQRDDAAPLIARLDAIGYHHPEYEWSIRGQ